MTATEMSVKVVCKDLPVVAQPVAETAQSVGILRRDVPAEMEDDVSQLVELPKICVDDFTQCESCRSLLAMTWPDLAGFDSGDWAIGSPIGSRPAFSKPLHEPGDLQIRQFPAGLPLAEDIFQPADVSALSGSAIHDLPRQTVRMRHDRYLQIRQRHAAPVDPFSFPRGP